MSDIRIHDDWTYFYQGVVEAQRTIPSGDYRQVAGAI